MAYENTGYLAFANALANAPNNFGNAYDQQAEAQQKLAEKEKQKKYLFEIAPLAEKGDWAGMSRLAFERGDAETGLKALAQAQEQKKLADQRAYDAQALGLATGGGAATGVTGGVTPNPQPMSLPGGRYGVSQAYDLIKKVGGTDEEARVLAAISQPESSGNPMAHNPKGADDSYGLWQINMRGALGPERMKQFGLSSPEDLYNPETNAKAALALARARGGYGDWSTYNSGKHMAFLQNGAAPRVQVADASGAIPASAMPQPQGGPAPPDQEIAKHTARRDNALRALSMQGISDNARAQAKAILDDANSQLDRLDRRANQQKPDVRQFGDTVYRVDAQGNLAPVKKVEKSPNEKAATEGQAKAARYSTVMADANDIISGPEAQSFVDSATGNYGRWNKFAEALPMGMGHGMESEAYQRYSSAKESFLTSKLRDDSGATIGTPEYAREEKAMFPQPGDSQKLIEEKAQRRRRAIEAMSMESAPSFQEQFKSRISGKSGQPLPANVLDEARAAIAVKGRDAVINRLKENGFDTSGL